MLGELIEAIKSYDKVSSIKNKYGDRIVFLCGTLWLKESFKACVFYDYIKRQKSDDFYINKIAAQLKEVVELGIDSFSMCIMRDLNEETHYYVLKNNGEYIWRERLKMFCELNQEAKEILEIYNHVFTNSKADDKGRNAKIPKELETEEARKFFDKARELGLIGENNKWLRGLQLLSCFCDEMSKRLGLGKGGRISWQPFEAYFGVESRKLRSNLNDVKKTGKEPSDINLVNEVFK